MIPSSVLFDQSTIAALLDHEPLVQQYRALFSLLDWSTVEHWQAQRRERRPAHPESAYLKAFLIRIQESMLYTAQLRRFLLCHPLLVIELGFRLVLDQSAPYGFDVERTLPCEFWFRQKLRQFDPGVLQALLQSTVRSLQDELPGLGETVAIDVKHIYAWVKENNWRTYVADRYDKTKRLAGDPDCRLGVKRSTNQELSDGSTEEKKELIWGYGTGVAVSSIADYGTVVLAEYTQPFNEGDITYFRTLYHQAVLALNQFPTYLTADGAYDAWYVYEAAARHGGIAAVPLNAHTTTTFEPDGVPLCPKGLRMHPTYRYLHTYGYHAQRYRCPLLFPHATGQSCEHEQFQKGKGCQKDINDEVGGRARVLMDRSGPLFRALYNQRSGCERTNARAKELGIERPRLRNGRSIAHLNTLIYVIVNVRILQKAKSINTGLLLMN